MFDCYTDFALFCTHTEDLTDVVTAGSGRVHMFLRKDPHQVYTIRL